MARLIFGERIGKQARVRLGCTAAIFDSGREKMLLTCRTDNGQWCLPGGGLDSGESVAEACEREVLEETGLQIRVMKLIGVYSNPHQIIEYADGNRFQIVALHFEADIVGGELQLSDETTEVGFFSKLETEQLDVMMHHRERIVDSFNARCETFVR